MTGYQNKRSSVYNVFDLVSSIQQHKTERYATTVICLDVKGAFDNFHHYAIPRSLTAIANLGRMLVWICDYLHGRLIHIRTQEGDTSFFEVTKGIPQGGVIRHVIFNVSLLSFPGKLSDIVSISLYADDIFMWVAGKNRGVLRL